MLIKFHVPGFMEINCTPDFKFNQNKENSKILKQNF